MKQNTINTINTINPDLIPDYVTHVTSTLEKAGFEAFLVGGCVRDLILSQILSGVERGREVKDWDITTNATPEQIIPLFEKTVYENTFGTVGVVFKDVSRETELEPRTYNLEPIVVEVTPYRTEAKYSDFRHPDEVKFSDNIEDDLKRRDFTMNALAFSTDGTIKDMFEGIKDIKDKVIRCVGNPNDRFQEDALRMLRAIRLSVQLDFAISHETSQAIIDNADLIKNVSFERIRDEFSKIIMSNNPMAGVEMLRRFGLLKYIIPELEQGIDCQQGGAHIYDVYQHLLQALGHAADKKWPFEIRLSALFHDIGKPKSRRFAEGFGNSQTNLSGPRISSPIKSSLKIEARPDHAKLLSDFPKPKKQFTFYGHEVIGARMAKQIMERLRYPKTTTDLVVSLIRNHMFFSDTETITLSAVRRIVQKVSSFAKASDGQEEGHPVWDLMKVRECDRVGMKKKEAPYRLRKYHAMIEEVLHDPISVGQLAINGEDLIKMELHPPTEDGRTGIKPGPRMGWILHALLEEVLDDPTKNTKEHLSELAKSLDMLGDNELKALGERGKVKKEDLEEEEVKRLHMKHGV